MYYNFNKVLNDAKKYNIKIAERGFGQTYYLREKKAIHMLQSYAGMTHKLTDNQGRPKLDQAIEIVLNLLEEQDNRIKELESDKEIKDKMVEMYIKHIYRSCDFDNRIKTKEQIKQFFENLAKERGEINE